MADVRSLLRGERAQRRVQHPQAIYSATGTLECSVCRIPVKSDLEIWNKHLKSTQHAMRQERLRLSASQTPTTLPERAGAANGEANSQEISVGSKKRKASDGNDDSRKKPKPVVDLPGGYLDEIIEANNANTKPDTEEAKVFRGRVQLIPEKPMEETSNFLQALGPIDEDEYAAFERDVATLQPDLPAPSALIAAASITAAPLTAAELAAQSREQANLQSREKREAEMEGEKEDAARALEEEFDEMEGLEERVKRLREKREQLRIRRAQEVEEKQNMDTGEEDGARGHEELKDDEDSEDDEDDNDGWGLWGR